LNDWKEIRSWRGGVAGHWAGLVAGSIRPRPGRMKKSPNGTRPANGPGPTSTSNMHLSGRGEVQGNSEQAIVRYFPQVQYAWFVRY